MVNSFQPVAKIEVDNEFKTPANSKEPCGGKPKGIALKSRISCNKA